MRLAAAVPVCTSGHRYRFCVVVMVDLTAREGRIGSLVNSCNQQLNCDNCLRSLGHRVVEPNAQIASLLAPLFFGNNQGGQMRVRSVKCPRSLFTYVRSPCCMACLVLIEMVLTR